MKKNPSYKIAVIISILLHVVVLGFLFVHLSKPQKLADSSVNIIKAVVVNETSKHPNLPVTQPIKKEIKAVKKIASSEKIENIEQKTLHQHSIAPPPLEKPVTKPTKPQEEALLDQPDLAQKELEKQRTINEKKLKEKKELEKQKRNALAKKRREEEAKKLQHELALEKRTAQTEEVDDQNNEEDNEEKNNKEEVSQKLQEDLTTEQQELDSAKAQLSEGEVDKYKQKIIQAISQKWLMPDITNQELACQLLVHLGPGGVVVSVDVLKESGDTALDRSARTAVMKSSPLPVPEKAELFDKFRSLRLTFRPQGVVAG